MSNFVAKLIIGLIHVYRWSLSPFLKPSCRFDPSCSRYAIHAIEFHGLKKGGFLALKRLLRCHPYKNYGQDWGFDPVPQQQPPSSMEPPSPR